MYIQSHRHYLYHVRNYGHPSKFGFMEIDNLWKASEDIRFTTVGESLYAFVLAWPEGGKATIKTLAQGSAFYPKEIARVGMLGRPGPLTLIRNPTGLD